MSSVASASSASGGKPIERVHRKRIKSEVGTFPGPKVEPLPTSCFYYWASGKNLTPDMGIRYNLPFSKRNTELEEVHNMLIPVRYTQEFVPCVPNFRRNLPGRQSEDGFVLIPPYPLNEEDLKINSTIDYRPDWFFEGPVTAANGKIWLEQADGVFQGSLSWQATAKVMDCTARVPAEIARDLCAAYNIEGACLRMENLTTFQMRSLARIILAGVPHVAVCPTVYDPNVPLSPNYEPNPPKRGLRYYVILLTVKGIWVATVYDRATNELWIFDPTEAKPRPQYLKWIRDFVGILLEKHILLPEGEGREAFIVPIENEEPAKPEFSGAVCAYRLTQFFLERHKFRRATEWLADWCECDLAQHAQAWTMKAPCDEGWVFGGIARLMRRYLGMNPNDPLRPVSPEPLQSYGDFVANRFDPKVLYSQNLISQWEAAKLGRAPGNNYWSVQTLLSLINTHRGGATLPAVPFSEQQPSGVRSPSGGSWHGFSDSGSRMDLDSRVLAGMSDISMADAGSMRSGKTDATMGDAPGVQSSSPSMGSSPSDGRGSLPVRPKSGNKPNTPAHLRGVHQGKPVTPVPLPLVPGMPGYSGSQKGGPSKAAEPGGKPTSGSAPKSTPQSSRKKTDTPTTDRRTRSQAQPQPVHHRDPFRPSPTPAPEPDVWANLKEGWGSPGELGTTVQNPFEILSDSPDPESVNLADLFDDGRYRWDEARDLKVAPWEILEDEWAIEPITLDGWCGWDAYASQKPMDGGVN